MDTNQRIQDLESRVLKLEQEVAVLKGAPASVQTQVVKPQPIPHTVSEPKTECTPGPIVEPIVAPIPGDPIIAPEQPPVVKKEVFTETKSLESFIGMHGMAVGASILIFIAIVMFATIVIPMLGVAFKIAAMFVFSASFIVAGEISAKRKGHNKWNTALMGCGTGAIFVSLFLTYGYFKVINVITLYILLVLWAAYLCFLGKTKTVIFTVIGQCGILISTIASMGELEGENELAFVILMVMILFSEASFIISDLRVREFWGGLATSIGTTLSITIASTNFFLYLENGIDMLYAIIGLVVIVYAVLVQVLFVKDEQQNNILCFEVLLTVFPIIYFFFNQFRDFFTTELGDVVLTGIYTIIPFLAIWFLKKFQHIFNEEESARSLIFAILAVISWISLCLFTKIDYKASTFMAAIAIVALLFGALYYSYKKNSIWCRIYGLSIPLMVFYAGIHIRGLAFALLLLITLMLGADAYIRRKMPKNIGYNSFLYVIEVINIFVLGYYGAFLIDNPTVVSFVTLLIIFLIQVVVYKTKFAVETSANGQEYNVLFAIVNGISSICVMACYCIFSDLFERLLFGLLLVAFATISTKELMTKYKYSGAYVMLKYTFLCLFFLRVAEVDTILFSVAFILFAIISIALGFIILNKGIRIYGLILSIIGVVKLILFDMDYDNPALRALSFLVCGLICFGISFIYHKLDKLIED